MGYSHGNKWTREIIKNEVIEIVCKHGLDRMPTHSECVAIGKNDLACAISKQPNGWKGIAEELNLPIKRSCTSVGKKYENEIKLILESKGYKVDAMSQNFPYDLLVDDSVKVDVKASNLYKGKGGNFYSYGISKQCASCDIYILCRLNENDEIEKSFIIPSAKVVKHKQISMGENNSIYDKYAEKWEILAQYSKFFNQYKD